MKCPVTGATANSIKLYNGTIIPCYTLIWSSGVTQSKLVAELPCEHDRGHRIVTNNYLEVPGYRGVYVLGWYCKQCKMFETDETISRRTKETIKD